MDYINTSLDVFFACVKKKVFQAFFFRFLLFVLITLINRSTFRVSQEETACRIYLEMKKIVK